MHRIDSPHSIKNQFHVSAPGAIDDDKTTEFTSEWLNAVQEEICGVIEVFGGKLAKGHEFERQMATVLQELKFGLNASIENQKKECSKKIIDEIEKSKFDFKSEMDLVRKEISKETQARELEHKEIIDDLYDDNPDRTETPAWRLHEITKRIEAIESQIVADHKKIKFLARCMIYFGRGELFLIELVDRKLGIRGTNAQSLTNDLVAMIDELK